MTPSMPHYLDPGPFISNFLSLNEWATGQWWTKPSVQSNEIKYSMSQSKKKWCYSNISIQVNATRYEFIALAVYPVTVTLEGSPGERNSYEATQPLSLGFMCCVKCNGDHHVCC